MKKFNIFIVGILICFLSFNVSAQEYSIDKYCGEEWVQGSEINKLGIVVGFTSAANAIERDVTRMFQSLQNLEEGIELEEGYQDSSKWEFFESVKPLRREEVKKYTIYETQMRTIIEAIDEFYKNTRNRRILITGAFEYVSMSLQGATDEELKEKLEYLRITEIPNPDEKK